MPDKMNKLAAIKLYMQKADKIAPNGGREVATSEFKGIPQADLVEMGQAAAKELGVEIG